MNTILRPHLCCRTLLPPISVSIWLFFLLVFIIKLCQTDSSSSESTRAQYGHSWMRAVVEAWKAQDCMASHPRKELDQYLASPLEDNDNIVSWWGVSFFLPYYFDDVSWTFFKHHAVQYSTLSRIARDYLAIQGSAVPSERAFSSGGLMATVRRNRFSGDIFEALQILKSGYCNGHISASEQAASKPILQRILKNWRIWR